MLTKAMVTPPEEAGVSTKCGMSRVAVADVLVSVTSYVISPLSGMVPGLPATAGVWTTF